jgi:hypothetical protein
VAAPNIGLANTAGTGVAAKLSYRGYQETSMTFKQLLTACALLATGAVQAQSCEGGVYLNPQVIRGEGASQSDAALRELVDFIRPTGLSVAPMVNVKETQEVLAAVLGLWQPRGRPGLGVPAGGHQHRPDPVGGVDSG